ncbi:MAG: ABC transporter ATP-binding protein [Actinomycetota bacterium]
MSIDIQDLTVRYGEKIVLDSISLEIQESTWSCLVGPNGAGKTTLLKSLLGMARYEGSIKDRGIEVFENHKRNVAFVPQHPQIPQGMSVAEYVMLGRSKRDGWGNESLASRTFVHKVLEQTNLYQMRNNFVSHLSGGEMQRALIARALAQEPDLLLLDEPTSALDLHHQIAVLNKIEGLKESGVTVISTMHDITLAAMFAEYIIVMKEGKILLSGTSEHVIHSEELKQAYDHRIEIYILENGRPVIVASKEKFN